MRKQFEDSSIELAGLGSAFEYHSPDSDELRQNIEGTKVYSQLAADVGAPGVRCARTGYPTAYQSKPCWSRLGTLYASAGNSRKTLAYKIRLEVHGRQTSHLPHIRTIMEIADRDNVSVCWNSNPGEVVDGSVKSNFDLVKDWIRLVHINELHRREYPWRELFSLLKAAKYDGYCLAEIRVALILNVS